MSASGCGDGRVEGVGEANVVVLGEKGEKMVGDVSNDEFIRI
jgi:hypothetical protein